MSDVRRRPDRDTETLAYTAPGTVGAVPGLLRALVDELEDRNGTGQRLLVEAVVVSHDFDEDWTELTAYVGDAALAGESGPPDG